MKKLFFLLLIILMFGSFKENPTLKIALLKYNGGGDWYANPTSLPNLIKFCNKELGTNIDPDNEVVEPGSKEIFNYPFIHITGHGNVSFSPSEIENLRAYLIGGGFLHADDNYGMDMSIRKEIKKLFPECELVQLPYSHPIFHQKYNFKSGVPKIHEHDGKPAQAFGVLYKGRLVCLYTYQTDLGDGWEDTDVHKDPVEKHIEALKMGANILEYVFMQN